MSLKEKLQKDNKLIVGLGNALVDILIHESDAFVSASDEAEKGGMVYVDSKIIRKTLASTTANPTILPGGSVCNTIIGISCLGGASRFIGKCGRDEFGVLFETDLTKYNVDPVLFKSSTPTGSVLSIITPDAQRTMLTYLGASSENDPGEMTPKCFANASLVYLDGYLLFNKDLLMAALNVAKELGAAIALDLASFTVAEQSKAFLDKIVREYVDIFIANEDEARVFTGCADEDEAISALSEYAEIAVLKLGKRGSVISEKGSLIRVAAQGPGTAVDTTGAGDLWAAGFLFGLINGMPLKKCGELGSACGYEVCRVVGASIPEQGWVRIRTLI